MNTNNLLSKTVKTLTNDIVYYLVIACVLLLYNLSLWLNVILYLAFIIILAANIKKDRFLYTFVSLVFFEIQMHSTMIISPWMFTSLVKVYYIIFAVRVVIDAFTCIQQKSIDNRFKIDILSSIIAVILITTSIFYERNMISALSYQIKTAVVVLYIVYHLNAKKDTSDVLGDFLKVLALSAFISGIYALTYGVYWDNRLCSSLLDPNYASLVYGAGLFSSLGAKKINKYIRWILILSNTVFLLMTMSITGFLVIAVLVIVYLIANRQAKVIAIAALVLIVIFSTLLLIPSMPDGKLDRVQTRINKFYVMDEDDYTLEGNKDYTQTERYLNYITNNRYYLNQAYGNEYQKLPLSQKLFGGNNIMPQPDGNYYIDKFGVASHNSFMDMLFMIGLIPTSILILCTLAKIILWIRRYKKFPSNPLLCLLLIKVMVIGIALTVSIFPYRYFLMYLIL